MWQLRGGGDASKMKLSLLHFLWSYSCFFFLWLCACSFLSGLLSSSRVIFISSWIAAKLFLFVGEKEGQISYSAITLMSSGSNSYQCCWLHYVLPGSRDVLIQKFLRINRNTSHLLGKFTLKISPRRHKRFVVILTQISNFKWPSVLMLEYSHRETQIEVYDNMHHDWPGNILTQSHKVTIFGVDLPKL